MINKCVRMKAHGLCCQNLFFFVFYIAQICFLGGNEVFKIYPMLEAFSHVSRIRTGASCSGPGVKEVSRGNLQGKPRESGKSPGGGGGQGGVG